MISDILYNEVLLEASNGRVDCGFIFNVIFQTILPDKQYPVVSEFPNLQIPTYIFLIKKNLKDYYKNMLKLHTHSMIKIISIMNMII